MSKNKKIFLVVFAVFIAGLNIALYIWALSLKSEEVEYLKGVYVNKFAFDNQGRVWAYVESPTSNGNELRLYEKGKLVHVYTEKDTTAFKDRVVQDLVVDNTGQVWLTIREDAAAIRLLVVFDGKEWHANRPPFMDSKNWITALAVNARGRVWIGIFNQGLYILDDKGVENYTVENSDLINNTITDITFDNQDRAWITSYDYHQTGGVNIFDGKEWQTFTPVNSSLLSTHVNTIVFDKQNWAWVGTERGISIFDGRNWKDYPANSKDLDRGVDSLAIDGQGRAWVSQTTFAPRTLVYDGKIWKYYFDPFHRDVWNTIIDRDGNIWSASDNGVVIIRPNSPQPVSFTTVVLSLAVTSGALGYLTILLLIVWVAVAFNVWRNIGISLISFPIYFLWIPFIMGSSNDDYYSKWIRASSYFFFENPAVYGTIGGILGGTAEIILRRYGNVNPKGWGVIGFVLGTILSFCALVVPLFFSQ